MRIAVLQSNSGIDPIANAAVAVKAIHAAKAGGAEVLFTPEMSNFLDRDRTRASANICAEADDIFLQKCQSAARAAQIIVVIGSIAVKGDMGKWRNRSIVINAAGEIIARYDKIHLFEANLATGESWRESSVYGAGTDPVIATLPSARLALSVCYDVRFPALYQAYSASGVDIISVPAAFTVPTGEAHWHVLLRARAIESSGFIVAAAQTGAHEDGRTTYGHSLVVDPWGAVLLDMGRDPGLGFADLDMAMLGDARTRIPSLKNRQNIGLVTLQGHNA